MEGRCHVSLAQYRSTRWARRRQLGRIGPEVGNAGDQTSVVELEEAKTRLRALRAGELDPAHRARAFDEDPLDGDVPFAWKALHVETDIGLTPANPLPRLRPFVRDVVGNHAAERLPVSGFRRRPLGRDDVMRVGHRPPDCTAAMIRGQSARDRDDQVEAFEPP
jgi:hypothetical protein